MPPTSLSHPEVESGEAPSRLDYATKLVQESRQLWVLRIYPEAGEGGGSWRWVGREIGTEKGSVVDPARAREEAERRAKGKLRRYVAANRLNRLATLTYGGKGLHDPKQLRRDVGSFFRRLRRSNGDRPLAYAWVPEWHEGGHGLHVHVALGAYFRKTLVAAAWGHGFVDIRLVRNREASAGLSVSRTTARYLAKYLGKDMGKGQEAGLHRYEVAQGFQPRSFEVAAFNFDEVIDQALVAMDGYAVERTWHSATDPDWQGPPTFWLSWHEREGD